MAYLTAFILIFLVLALRSKVRQRPRKGKAVVVDIIGVSPDRVTVSKGPDGCLVIDIAPEAKTR